MIIGIMVFLTFDSYVNKTVSRILVTATFPVDTDILVSADLDPRAARVVDIIRVKGNPTISQYVGTKRLDIPFERLSLQFRATGPEDKSDQQSDKSRQIIVQNIQLTRPYSEDIYIADDYIDSYFDGLSNPDRSSGALVIGNAQGAEVLVSKEVVSQPNYWAATALAMIFSFGFLFLFRAADWSAIPAFSDISLGRDISSSHEFGTINGLRGIAALLVLMSHTAPGFQVNEVGLAMLFVISGFLLSKPFILAPNKIFSIDSIETFLVKRLKRILPMYYLYVFITYVVTLQLDVALRHFLFVQAEGHLWPMTQIFAFYMILPFILVFTSLLFKLNRALPIIVLSAVAYFWWTEMSYWMPFYNGQYFHPFFFYSFLIGVVAAYLQYGFIVGNQALQHFFKNWAWLLALIGLAITVLTIAWSAPIQPPAVIVPYIHQFFIKSVLCATIVLFALNTSGTILSAIISNWLFRSIGIVGFSFYILHGLGMQIVLNTQSQLLAIANPSHRSWSFMLLAFGVTYLMSIATYSWVERPFFGFRKRKNNVE